MIDDYFRIGLVTVHSPFDSFHNSLLPVVFSRHMGVTAADTNREDIDILVNSLKEALTEAKRQQVLEP